MWSKVETTPKSADLVVLWDYGTIGMWDYEAMRL